jgi:hypothetical protein
MFDAHQTRMPLPAVNLEFVNREAEVRPEQRAGI